MVGWPPRSAFQCARVADGRAHVVAQGGDVAAVRDWASVTKVAAALAVARCVAGGAVRLDDPAGPPGATLAHLLSHSSGLGLEADDRTTTVGSRRVYSNVGIDRACVAAGATGPAGPWVERTALAPLGLAASAVPGRPSSGGCGPVTDMVALGVAWLTDVVVDATTRRQFLAPFLPDLDGVVPGFGRFTPCWWGLGVELHGTKRHWMGSVASASAFGHFGASGTLLLVDPTRSLVVAAAAGEPFGPWAVDLWPHWTDEVLTRYGA